MVGVILGRMHGAVLVSAWLALVLLCACEGGVGDDASESVGDGGTGHTDGGDPTTGDSDETVGASATSSAGTSTASTSGAPSTTGDPIEVCEAYCNKLVECIPDEIPEPGPCLDQCASVFTEGDDACDVAASTYFSCIAALDCDAFYGHVEYCSRQQEAMTAACGRR